MEIKTILKKATSCLLTAIMLLSAVALMPTAIYSASAAETATVKVADNAFAINDNVTIKLGAKDYYGREINDIYMFLVYTVTAVRGDMVTIESSYSVSSVSYAVKLDMNEVDLEYKSYVEESDTDTEIHYVIGVGSDVYIKKGAINYDTGEEINAFWRIFTFTVTDIEDGIATVQVRLTLDYLNRMGITSDTIANMFNIDKDNQWLVNIFNIATAVGYTQEFRVSIEDLSLTANGVPDSAKIGTYTTKIRMTVTATTFSSVKGEVTENITIPAGTEIMVADYTNGYATVYIKLNNKYYKTTKIELSDCTLVREGRELFGANGLEEGSYVKVTDLYGTDTDSFQIYEECWFNDVESLGDLPKIYDVLFKIKYAWGDAAVLVPASPMLSDGTSIEELYTAVLPVAYIKSAAGTYRTKSAVTVYSQTLDSDTLTYSYKKIGTFAKNSVFYSDGQVVDGKLFVRYNGLYGCVDTADLEYASENIINYTTLNVGDTVYIKYGTEKDYDGTVIFDERLNRNYFGNNYSTDIFTVPYTVKFVANDWVKLEEEEESRIAHNRNGVNDYRFTVILSYSRVSTTVTKNTTALGDVDLNGKIEMADIVQIQRHLADLTTLTSDMLTNADVDGNNTVNLVDVTTIQQYIAELIKKFPASNK